MDLDLLVYAGFAPLSSLSSGSNRSLSAFELATTTTDEWTFAALGRQRWQGRAFLCRDPHVQLLIRTYPPDVIERYSVRFPFDPMPTTYHKGSQQSMAGWHITVSPSEGGDGKKGVDHLADPE